MNTKVCKKCNVEHPIDMFVKAKFGKNGLSSRCKLCDKAFRVKYKEAGSDFFSRYYAEHREQIISAVKTYREKNKHTDGFVKTRRANCAKRRATKLQRTPPWLSSEHLEAIKEFYIKAKDLELETGTRHHVDHIVPLLGETVCGLHVPWNLQVLTAYDNLSKGNKFNNDYCE